jgi:hypothetical protein
MKPKTLGTSLWRRVEKALRCAFIAMLFAPSANAQQDPAMVTGTWHVAVPGWGIEDHLLVVQARDGTLEGKFEFADVKGMVSGTQLHFHVADADGQLILHFAGRINGDDMKGEVKSPEGGPLVQHQPGLSTTTEWTAKRETSPR